MERRKHKRFSATAFLNRAVSLSPIPPYVGRHIKGKLIDLSAGGLAIFINHIIPQGTRLNLTMTFPDHSVLKSETEVKHMLPREKGYLHGLEFFNLDPAWAERISKMSDHFLECEQRINAQNPNPCVGAECAIFSMCNKPERTHLLVNIDDEILLEFKAPSLP